MSSSKGSSWERDVSKYLTFWLTKQNEEYAFWRSPGSGSIGTVTGTNPNLHGDIIPVKPEAEAICSKFSIECKNGYRDASFDKHLKFNKNSEIENFWDQCVEDATMSGKYPMLIFKKKGFSSPWVGIDLEVYNKLKSNLGYMRFVHLSWEKGIDLREVYFFEMSDFFEVITPSILSQNI